MSASDIRASLPRNGQDGQEICDAYGNRWRFDAESKGWISAGKISSVPDVSEDNDGLVTPDIFENLRRLESYSNSNPDLRPFKLLPGRDAYWYYFRSSDKLFRFRQEGENCLRIEIDKGRFFQILMKQVCPGSKGPKGEQGDKGLDGTPGAPELCYSPSAIVDNRLDFAIFVPTPLTVSGPVTLPSNIVPDVSVRLFSVTSGVGATAVDQLDNLAIFFSGNDPRNEVLPQFQETRNLFLQRSLGVSKSNVGDIELSQVAIFDSDAVFSPTPDITIDINPVDPSKITVSSSVNFVQIDETLTSSSVQFDPTTGIVSGSIFLPTGSSWEDLGVDFCVKARQRGPKGPKGIPGECRVRIVECLIDGTNIRATCPIVNTRLDCENEIIYTLCADLLAELCYDKIALLPDSDSLADGNALTSVFASAEMTLEECKRINRYVVELPEDDIPDLDLLHWNPQAGCFSQRHYDRHKFNWIPDTNIPACDSTATWFGPDSVRDGQYPHAIVTAPQPTSSECCQDDFFYCPNVQDAPCGEEEEPPEEPPVPPPVPPPPVPPPVPPPTPPPTPPPSSPTTPPTFPPPPFEEFSASSTSGSDDLVGNSPQIQLGTRSYRVRT